MQVYMFSWVGPHPARFSWNYCYTTIHIYKYNMWYVCIYIIYNTILYTASARQRPYSFSLNRHWELAKRITERVSIGDQVSSLHASYYPGLFLSRTFLGSIQSLDFRYFQSTRPRTVKDKSVAMTRPVAGAVQASGNFHEARTSPNTFLFWLWG